MSTKPDRLRNPTSRLPDISLPAGAAGAPVRIRQGRKAPVLFLSHGADCERCRAYAQELETISEELEEWDGRLLVVAADDADADAGRRIASAAGVEAPAVIVADQWGAIHEATGAGSEHRFPAPEQVIAAVRYLAVRCPECEGESL